MFGMETIERDFEDEDQIEYILNSHPEWSRKCIEM